MCFVAKCDRRPFVENTSRCPASPPANAATRTEGGEPGDVVPISIRFSIAALPSEPMQARWGDERVGYFNTVYTDLGDHRASREGLNTDLVDTEVGAMPDGARDDD